MRAVVRLAPLLGRVLISQIFIVSGLSKLSNWSGTAGMMEAKGMPLVPLLLAGAIVVELGGGLALLVGLWGRSAALVLFLFLIPTTIVFHNFWAYADARERMPQLINFQKNLAIMGGLLFVATFGPGAVSVDARGGRVSGT